MKILISNREDLTDLYGFASSVISESSLFLGFFSPATVASIWFYLAAAKTIRALKISYENR